MPKAKKVQKAEDILVNKLTEGGRYTPEQAQALVKALDVMMRGRDPTVTSQRMVQDLNSLSGRWVTMLEDGETKAQRISRLSKNDINSMFAGVFLSRPPKEVKLREEKVAAPVRTYKYEVALAGRKFEVELNTRLEGGRVIALGGGRYGDLKKMLLNKSPAVLGIIEKGKKADPRKFTMLYVKTYNEMLKTKDASKIRIGRV